MQANRRGNARGFPGLGILENVNTGGIQNAQQIQQQLQQLNHVSLNQIMQMGMRSLPATITLPASNVWNTFMACSRFWILFYGIWLLFLDMFFTIFPTTLVFIILLTLALHYSRIPTPPIQFLNAVFGVDPNIDVAAAAAQPYKNNNNNPNQNQDHIVEDIATAILGTALQGVLGQPSPALAGMAINVLKKTLENHAVNQGQGQGQGQRNIPQFKHEERQNSSGSASNSNRSSLEIEDQEGYRTPTPDPILEQGFAQSFGAQLNRIPVPVIARRGAGLDVPENTLKAISYCKEKNCHFVHFDIRLTRDNVAIVFHDKDLVRMAGIDRHVRHMLAQEIRNIDVSFLHPQGAKFHGAMVPTFDQAIDACIKQNIKFFFNIVDSSSQMVDVVLRAYQSYKAMYSMAVMTSFNWKIIYKIRRRDPKIIACLATPYALRKKPCNILEPGFTEASFRQQQHHHPRNANSSGIAIIEWYQQLNDTFQDWLLDSFLWWYVGICAILIERESVSKVSIREWGRRGIHTFLWSVNNPVEKLYLNQVLKVGYLTDTVVDDPVLHPHLDPTIKLASAVPTESDRSSNRNQNYKGRKEKNQNDRYNSKNTTADASKEEFFSPISTPPHAQGHEEDKNDDSDVTEDAMWSIPPSQAESHNSNDVNPTKTLNSVAEKMKELEDQRRQRQQQHQAQAHANRNQKKNPTTLNKFHGVSTGFQNPKL